MDHAEHGRRRSRPAWRGKWMLFALLAVAAVALWIEHRTHMLGILPYLIALACPLMHLFHHRHGHHHGGRPEAGAPDARTTPAEDRRHEQ
jgi:hypothetical protein